MSCIYKHYSCTSSCDQTVKTSLTKKTRTATLVICFVYSRYCLLKTSDFRLLRFCLLNILFIQDFGFPFTQMPFTQFAQKFRLLRFQKYVYSDAKKCFKTAAFRPGTQRYSQKNSPAAGSFTQIRLLRPRLLTILRFGWSRRARLQDTNKIDALAFNVLTP